MLPEVRNQVAEEAQALSLTIGVDARALSNPERQALHLPSDHAKLTLSLIWTKNQTNPLISVLRERQRNMECK